MRRAPHPGGARVGLRRRIATVAIGAGLAGAGLGACGGPAGHGHGGAGASAGAPAPGAGGTGAAQATGAERRAPGVPPHLARLRQTLERALRVPGRRTGAVVLDLTSGRTLFALRPQVARPPASLEKLYTTVAVLRRLGPDDRLATTVLGTGHLGARGVWHGNLYLKGGGDPTFGDSEFNLIWEQGYGPTATQLALQLVARGIRRVTGRLIGDASLFDERPGGPATGYAADVPDFGGRLSALSYDHGAATPRLSAGAFAARELARVLRTDRVRVRASGRTARAPRPAILLGRVLSPPVRVLLRLMDVPSDDLFAELLTEQLGLRARGWGSIARGAAVIASVVHGYGIHPRIVDGSGLSRDDSSSPVEIVELLRDVWGTALGARLTASLPVVGVNGTVRSIALRTPARRRCLAKTGTLNGVTNLAGYCRSLGGHELAFALFVDGLPNSIGLRLVGRMVGAIARY